MRSVILAVVLAGGALAHAQDSFNRYRLKSPPDFTVILVQTAYSTQPRGVFLERIRRLVVPTAPGSLATPMAVAYETSDLRNLSGLRNALVQSAIADVVVTTQGVAWMEFPANVNLEPPLDLPPPPGRTPMLACYAIRVSGPNVTKTTMVTTDQLGTQSIMIGQPESLCVPASIYVVGDVPVPGIPPVLPPAPPGPARLCFGVKPEKPGVEPGVAAIASAFTDTVSALEPVREHCVDATIAD